MIKALLSPTAKLPERGETFCLLGLDEIDTSWFASLCGDADNIPIPEIEFILAFAEQCVLESAFEEMVSDGQIQLHPALLMQSEAALLLLPLLCACRVGRQSA